MPGKKGGGERYNWDEIRMDYITTPEASLSQIAKKYGCRNRTVEDKSASEGWVAQKKAFQKKVSDKAYEKVAEDSANRLGRILYATDSITTKLEVLIKNEDVDIRTIKDALQSLKIIEEINRSICSIKKADELHKEKFDEERLKLERDKFEFEKSKANRGYVDSNECGILILPEVIDEQ